MPIIINDSRRLHAASTPRREDTDVSNADKVLVQPLSTYFEGSERKDAQSEPYLVLRAHAAELEALGTAKVVEPKKPVVDEPDVDEEDESEDESETEQPDDGSEQSRAPRRRGRPRKG